MSPPPTLLLADDSVAIQRVMTLTFADQPVRLVVARDGQDAINRMASERPDLVLADTNMPCVDGYELARWVRQQPHLSAVPVLLLTGITEPVDEQRLHDSGANGVLEKPLEPSHVISRVKELLGMKGAPPPASTRLVTSAEPRVPARAPATPDAPDAAPPPARTSARPAGPPRRDRATEADDVAAAPDRASFSAAALDAATSETADAFESLLAAELGDAPSPGAAPRPDAGDDLVPDPEGERVLDMLASRVAERLAPEALRDEAVQAVAGSMQSAVTDAVREGIAADVRAAVNAAVQAAIKDAVAASVGPIIDEIVGREVRDTITPQVTAALRDLVGTAVQLSVAETVPPAVQDAISTAVAGHVREAVHDASERLVREEIQKIRERRG